MVAYDSYSSDDDEDKCPLCIEDMDITDRNFKPCPCGFQICQFCYNNIRSGPEQYNRCPACRRPYDDASIEYKVLTPEDMKKEQERKQRKEQERKQREREKNKDIHHFDQRDKKHLANVRVIQKNLVYVIGLNPTIPSEELQQMLRRDEFFGQYGKIQKIVVNKRVNGNGNLGVGVYVTFARKEDAARCIAAVDGSINDGKYLRAAYGTTKYCSSYLRGQNCPNQNCMFLHEPGEEADSFNRHPNHLTQPGSASGSGPASPAVSSSNLSQPSTSMPTPTATLPNATANSTIGGHQPIPPGTTLQAANVPALPAWGKYTPQIPPVQKLTGHDLPNPTGVALSLITRNLASLKPSQWDYQFISEFADMDTKFPAMFSLPMDDKKRLKSYNKAISELDKLLPAQGISESADQEAANATSSSTKQSSPTSSTKSDSKKNNSQHLLAHLMRDVNSVSPQPERREEEYKSDKLPAHNSEGTRKSAARIGDENSHSEESEENQIKQSVKPKLDHAAIASVLDKHQLSTDPLHSAVGDALRQVGSYLMQPPNPVQVDIPEDIIVGPSHLRDDGPSFDLNNIPHVQMAGDVEPSIWSAIEELSRQKDILGKKKEEFSAAKAQSKKRMKRIRV